MAEAFWETFPFLRAHGDYVEGRRADAPAPAASLGRSD